MVIKEFQYTKDWRNPTDFPTFEGNEAKVREDMQYPLDEIKKYLNGEIVPNMQNLVHSRSFSHMRINGGVLQVSADEIVWQNIGAIGGSGSNGSNGADGEGGEDGENGKDGINGLDGVGIDEIVYQYTDSQGGNVYAIKLTDGTSYNITAPKGKDGTAGYTPVKGVDYWTPTEIEELAQKAAEKVDVNITPDGPAYFFAQYGKTTPAELDKAYNAGKTIVLGSVFGESQTLFIPLYTRAGYPNTSYWFLWHAQTSNSSGENFSKFYYIRCSNIGWSTEEWGIKPSAHAPSHAIGGDDEINPADIGAVAIDQGAEHEGKVLVVGNDGKVTLGKVSTGSGGAGDSEAAQNAAASAAAAENSANAAMAAVVSAESAAAQAAASASASEASHQAAKVEANVAKAAVADCVELLGSAEIASIAINESATSPWTMELTMQDGDVKTISIAHDSDGNPTSITANGVTIPISYRGVG